MIVLLELTGADKTLVNLSQVTHITPYGAGQATMLHFAGGRTLDVAESYEEIHARIAKLLKGTP